MAYLTVAHLSRRYGTIEAVSDFSMEISRGEIYSLVGPDGAGKTTIMRILCNLLSPDSGSAVIKDLDVFKEFDRVKPLLGYMPQAFSLYPDLSVAENMIFYAGIYGITGGRFRNKRDELYTFSNLEPFANRRAGNLSGGMKQKLALSCALVHDPEFLLLDEPTTGVDPLSRRQLWEILLQLKRQGVTILVTTPYMDEVARTDHTCFIFNGKKLAEGTPSQLAQMFDGKVYFLDIEPNAEIVNRMNRTASVTAQRFGAGIHLYTPRETQSAELMPILQELNIEPQRLRTAEPGLEDTFIQLMERPHG